MNYPSMERPSIHDGHAVRSPACEEETLMETSRSAKRKCAGWNAKGIRPPNARKFRRPPESQVSQMAIKKHPKTLRLNPRQLYRP